MRKLVFSLGPMLVLAGMLSACNEGITVYRVPQQKPDVKFGDQDALAQKAADRSTLREVSYACGTEQTYLPVVWLTPGDMAQVLVLELSRDRQYLECVATETGQTCSAGTLSAVFSDNGRLTITETEAGFTQDCTISP